MAPSSWLPPSHGYRFASRPATSQAFGVSTEWSPSTWRDRPTGQQPEWPDEAALDRVLKQLASLPPLVFAGEARNLTNDLGRVANGEAFLLHAGDRAPALHFVS